MPQVRIETRNGWLQGRQNVLFDAIQAAMVEAIKIPPDDRCYRLVTYDAADFPTPPGKTERCVLIEIGLLVGRSLAAKRALYAAIARNLKTSFGIEASDVRVILEEVQRENWGIDGKPSSEIDLGFKVEV